MRRAEERVRGQRRQQVASAGGGELGVGLVGVGDRGVAELDGVQTPQAFGAAELLAAYARAEADGFDGTDTAACWARYTDLPVVAVPSTPRNLKITFPEDLALALSLA